RFTLVSLSQGSTTAHQINLKFKAVKDGTTNILVSSIKFSGADSSNVQATFDPFYQNQQVVVTITTGSVPIPSDTIYNAGNPLSGVSRYFAADGPCYGKSSSSCVFDTRTFYLDASGNQIWESITAYGKGYNFYNSNQTPVTGVNNFDLTTVQRYKDGPCVGRAAGTCTFDTRAFWYTSDGKLVEAITAYGKIYNFSGATPFTAWPSNGSDLTTISRYATGPCAGRGAGTCKFDTLDYYIDSTGKQVWESITAYGKGYNFYISGAAPVTGVNNFDLTTVQRYKDGPCFGKAAGQCVFDTRTFWKTSLGMIESITAYGKYYNFLGNAPWPALTATTTPKPPTSTPRPPTSTPIPPTPTKAPTKTPTPVPKGVCTDSDNGNAPFVKGTVVHCPYGMGCTTYFDYCRTTTAQSEMICLTGGSKS
ncbi:MAG: hypothetical protein Q7T74_05220, partial [Candidatus Saccharibacteria bacterium]|nr:hypothetical protein [Candidatus Saccharibacteria bacterium]